MAKSRRNRARQRATPSSGRERKPGVSRRKLIVIAVCGLALAAAAYGYFGSRNEAAAFDELARQGADALSRVDVRPSEGRAHLPVGEIIRYGTNPPTSGPHYPVWIDPGFYDTPQSQTNLVHSLEHGMIVIYYDAPGDAVMERLRDWASLFAAPWSGIVAVPRSGLGEELILTAWRRTLRLDRFEETAAAAFIDAFRGRGPENPVR